MQDSSPNTPATSPDGLWTWNGTEWVPNTSASTNGESAQQPSQANKKTYLGRKVVGGTLGVLLTMGIATGGIAALGRTEAAGSEGGAEAVGSEGRAQAAASEGETDAAASDGQWAPSASTSASGDGESPVASAPNPEEAPEQGEGLTAGQAEAFRLADLYFENHGGNFSRPTLIGWLEQRGVSREDAVYVVEGINPDWNYHAASVGSIYLSGEDLSRDELIQRLIADGFTQPQAAYGADTAIQWWADDDEADTDPADEGGDEIPADDGVQPTPIPEAVTPEPTAGP